MAPLEVDPGALDGAGSAVASVGDGLGSVISTLTGALSGCAGMAGNDPAGAALGRSYDGSASKLIQAMATARNGLCSISDGVRMSAHNYSVAEAMSNVSGRSDPLPMPPSTGSISAGSSPSAVGAGSSAPAGWGWVAPYIGMIWPNGDSAKLRAAAAAWNAAGTEFLVGEKFGLAGPLGTVRAQQIPEAEAIANALTDSDRSCAAIKQQCSAIADQLNAYAARIDQVHAAILDLLSRICDPMTGIKEVWDILTDKDEDEIKKVADDIRTVVNQFTSEVNALGHQIATAVSEATTVISTMGRYAGKEWDQFLHGTDVGRAINQVGQFGKGVGEEVGGLLKDDWTYGPMRALVDPNGWYHSWKDMVGGMAPLVGLGGDHAPGVGEAWKNLGKGITHWDEWKTNPAEAAGKSTFDIATLFAPGGGEAAAASKGARAAADAGEAAAKASRGETAVADAAKSGIPAAPPPAPRVEAPPVERPPAPPADRPSVPPDKPAAPPPAKPASAPTDGSLPHSPTECRPQVGEKPVAGDMPKSPVSAGEHPASTPSLPGDRLPSTHPQSLEPAAARPSGPPVGNPAEPAMAAAHAPQSAPAGSAPHLPLPDSSPPNAHPSLPPHDGSAPSGHSGGDHGGTGDHGGGDHRGAGGYGGGNGEDHQPPKASDVFPDAKPYGDLTKEQYEAKFIDDNGQLIYPDVDDPAKPYAIPGTPHDLTDAEISKLDGKTVDRIGHPGGAWLAPEGTPYEGRALPHDSLDKEMHKYIIHAEKGLPPGWKIEESLAAPWFGHPGGEPQYRIIAPPGAKARTQDLIDRGFLEDICGP